MGEGRRGWDGCARTWTSAVVCWTVHACSSATHSAWQVHAPSLGFVAKGDMLELQRSFGACY